MIKRSCDFVLAVYGPVVNDILLFCLFLLLHSMFSLNSVLFPKEEKRQNWNISFSKRKMSLLTLDEMSCWPILRLDSISALLKDRRCNNPILKKNQSIVSTHSRKMCHETIEMKYLLGTCLRDILPPFQ